MRQTIVKDNIQVRLQDLLGSESNDSSKFSIQSSMLQNFERVCKAMVGDNVNGKVMAGMKIDVATRKIRAGYAITYSGKVIKFGADRGFGNVDLTAGTRINVYANYIEELRSVEGNPADKPDNGGYQVKSIRNPSAKETLIIKDQVGSSSNPTGDGDTTCATYNTGAISLPNGSDSVHVATIIVDTNGEYTIFYPNPVKSVDYTFSQDVRSQAMWTASTTLATNVVPAMLNMDGRFNLKQVRVALKTKTTSAMRDGDGYRIRLYARKYDSIGRLISGDSYIGQLDDYAYEKNYIFNVNQEFDQSVGYIGLCATATTASFADTTGYADIQYVIEKLN